MKYILLLVFIAAFLKAVEVKATDRKDEQSTIEIQNEKCNKVDEVVS